MSFDKTKKCVSLIVLFIYVFTFVSYCYAERVTTVEGLIEEIKNDSIKVRGKYYNIAGVPLMNPSGENVSKDELKIGEKVEIFFYNGKVTNIVVHEYMVE